MNEQKPTYEQLDKLERIFMPYAAEQRTKLFESQAKLRKPGDEDKIYFAHYTSAEAALAIINSKRVWMRNNTAMSDYREIEHGFDVLAKAFEDTREGFEKALDKCAPGAAKAGFDQFLGWWNSIRLDTYIASFSEHDPGEAEHGRLSMWRAFGGSRSARVAIIFKVPYNSRATLALGMMFSPVAYLDVAEVRRVIMDVIDNIKRETAFLHAVGTELVTRLVFGMLLAGTTCLKHQGFKEEREWRAVYHTKLWERSLLERTNTAHDGVPQIIYKIPLDRAASPEITTLDFTRIFDRLIIGPSNYPWVMGQSFVDALMGIGVSDAAARVVASGIPIRT
jgi:Protein of unknown function (DUF2971)